MNTPVMTLGTFDLFHKGHVRLLKRAADLGPVTVGLNTDQFVTKYKGRAPVLSYADRRETLEACKYVYRVVKNDGPGRELITSVKPKYVVIGNDWLDNGYAAQLDVTQGFLASIGVSVVFVPYTESVSTTRIREAVIAQAPPRGDRHVLSAPFGLQRPSTASTAGINPAA